MAKPLGRGLSSLLGSFDEEEKTPQVKEIVKEVENNTITSGVNEIEISKIDNNPSQPRKNFDPSALQDLAESIKVHGVIQPIIVVANGNRYTIIAGERRFRASKLAGKKTIPAIVKQYSEKERKEIALLENVQREDLNPIETARGMQELMDKYDFTQEKLSERLGKSRPVIANFLRLLSLQPEVIALVESGKLSAGHARSLVVVADPEVQVRLAKMAVTKRVTVRDMEKIVKDLQNPKSKVKKQYIQSNELKELIKLMQSKLGTKVSVVGDDHKGRIYIDYYSQDDLDTLYQLVSKR